MPILDNGEPLTINRCPECNSRRKLLYQNTSRSGEENEVKCKKCDWRGSRGEMKHVKKPF